MGRRRCCCQDGCWLYIDNFNIGDTDSPPNWYDETGEWGVASFVLVEDWSTGVDGTSGAKIVCTDQQPPYHAGEQYISIDVYDPQDGDVYYLYPCATSPTSIGSALEVKFECTSAPAYWTVTCGSEVAYYTDVTESTPGFVRIGACVHDPSGMAKAWVSHSAQQGLWNDDCSPGIGRYSGLGHDNASRLNTFDNYEVGEFRDRDDNICFECFCHCRDHFLKKELNLEIYNPTGRADCMTDGGSPLTATMTWEWNSGFSRWACTVSGYNHAPPDGNGSTWSRTFYLYCADELTSEDEGMNFNLVHDPSGDCCNGGGESCVTSTPTYANCTASSLNLTFGPFKWTSGDLACATCYWPPLTGPTEGSYYVIITD